MTLPAELRQEADRTRGCEYHGFNLAGCHNCAVSYVHPPKPRALLHRAADALEWRDIASAPKDRSILLRDADGAVVSGKHYGGESWQTDEDMCSYFYCPTHWMEKPELDAPLPATQEGDKNSTNDEERV